MCRIQAAVTASNRRATLTEGTGGSGHHRLDDEGEGHCVPFRVKDLPTILHATPATAGWWLHRYRESGRAGMVDGPGRPHHTPVPHRVGLGTASGAHAPPAQARTALTSPGHAGTGERKSTRLNYSHVSIA